MDLAGTKVDVLVTAPINKDTIQGGQLQDSRATPNTWPTTQASEEVLMILAYGQPCGWAW